MQMPNKTANYQLNQWEPGDSFLRTDFNEDNAKIDTAIKEAAEAKNYVTGSYVGTGKSGQGENANVLNLGFRPSLVLILGGIYPSNRSLAVFISPSTIAGDGASFVTATWTDTGLSWYSNSPNVQLNLDGGTYYYIAFR